MGGRWVEGESEVTCCANATQLFDFIEQSPLALLNIRTLPVASMFPDDILRTVELLPQSVSCGVAAPAVAAQVGIESPRLGDILVFRRGQLVHRGLEHGLKRRLDTVLGLTSDRTPDAIAVRTMRRMAAVRPGG